MIRVLFTGSREDLPDRVLLKTGLILQAMQSKAVTVVVSDADLFDAYVIEHCDMLRIPIVVHGAYGKMRRKTAYGQNIAHDCSYPVRDILMVKSLRKGDIVVAAWNGASRGTRITADYAARKGYEVRWLHKKPEDLKKTGDKNVSE